MKGTIISIINNKGGVGKTSVTCNLAHALTRLDKRVLIIDMDAQSNATKLIGLGNNKNDATLYEFLSLRDAHFKVEDYIRPTEYEGLCCIPNIHETAGLEPLLIRNAPKSFHLIRERIRDYALANFDITLLDNPPNLGSFVLCSLYASDWVIIPTHADSAFSTDGLFHAMQLIEEVRDTGNPTLRLLKLLLNQVDRRTIISKVTVQYLQDKFKEDLLFETTIPVNTAFRQSEGAGQTILRYQPTAAGAKAYRNLAKEVIDLLSQNGNGGQSHGR